MKASRQQNQLSKLIDDEGIVASTNEQMGKVATDYFGKLFRSNGVTDTNSFFFAGFEAKVTEQMNQKLIREVTVEEFREAVFAIKPLSAPGCDGMNGLFFQQYWEIIGCDVVSEVKKFFHTGVFPEEWNFTQICLIPKITNPS